MGFLTESAEVGNIGLKQLREQREITTNRWQKIGLLEGLDGNVKENCAPVIRRVFAKLLANDIVSVQALNLPIGKLYFINPKTSVRVDGTGNTSPDGAYSNAAQLAPGDRTQFQEKSLYDSFYATEYGEEGDSLFDNSKGEITFQTGTAGGTAWSPRYPPGWASRSR